MSEDKTNEPLASRADKLICLAVFLVAVIVAAWLRFDQIGIKPFHHDEGVNSYFLLNLANSGNYKYDPTNYHGPTLYYFALVALRIFGETDLALRFSPILFGLLTVAMVWLLRDKLGNFGTPVAAFLMALSPCLVYYSRDFIHEMSFGCFSLGIVVGAWR
ncbi:MAG TPA: glycosyltransferase family 39 protein, partial [Blastocatellia bacterium]|nr:glycosyltransferase family 39 protein [Blastocatellia bacterium]